MWDCIKVTISVVITPPPHPDIPTPAAHVDNLVQLN